MSETQTPQEKPVGLTVPEMAIQLSKIYRHAGICMVPRFHNGKIESLFSEESPCQRSILLATFWTIRALKLLEVSFSFHTEIPEEKFMWKESYPHFKEAVMELPAQLNHIRNSMMMIEHHETMKLLEDGKMIRVSYNLEQAALHVMEAKMYLDNLKEFLPEEETETT